MTGINTIWQFELRKGNSANPRDGACLLDAVSWFEYGTLGDRPACVCPVIAAFARGINDAMSDAGRQRLKVFIPRLIGTVDPASEQARGEYLAWQAIRVFAPIALKAAGMTAKAQKLRTFRGTLAEAAAAAAKAAEAARAAAAAGPDASCRAAAGAAAVWAAVMAAKAAKAAKAEDAMIAALDGVLTIGRQAEPIEAARIVRVNASFELAHSDN